MGLVRRTAMSHRDYGEIWDYIAMAGRPDAADTLLRKFDETIKILSDFPGLGRARPELRPRLRSLPVGSYLIFYRPIRDGIELIRVIHGARDIRAAFRGRRPK